MSDRTKAGPLRVSKLDDATDAHEPEAGRKKRGDKIAATPARLWLLRSLMDQGYDTCRGMVVRARTAVEARALAQARGADETGNDGSYKFWQNCNDSSCQELTGEGRLGVVIVDFRAG